MQILEPRHSADETSSDSSERVEPRLHWFLPELLQQFGYLTVSHQQSFWRSRGNRIHSLSISEALRLASYSNLTNAPPSFSRGKISVTLMGKFSGIARFTNAIGSMMPKDELLKRFKRSVSCWSVSIRRLNSGVSLRGNKSTDWPGQ